MKRYSEIPKKEINSKAKRWVWKLFENFSKKTSEKEIESRKFEICWWKKSLPQLGFQNYILISACFLGALLHDQVDHKYFESSPKRFIRFWRRYGNLTVVLDFAKNYHMILFYDFRRSWKWTQIFVLFWEFGWRDFDWIRRRRRWSRKFKCPFSGIFPILYVT